MNTLHTTSQSRHVFNKTTRNSTVCCFRAQGGECLSFGLLTHLPSMPRSPAPPPLPWVSLRAPSTGGGEPFFYCLGPAQQRVSEVDTFAILVAQQPKRLRVGAGGAASRAGMRGLFGDVPCIPFQAQDMQGRERACGQAEEGMPRGGYGRARAAPGP